MPASRSRRRRPFFLRRFRAVSRGRSLRVAVDALLRRQGVVTRPPRAFTDEEALALSSVCSARAAEPGLSSVRFYNKSDVDASNGDMSPPQSRQLWCGGAKYCESCKQGRGLATRVRRTLPAAPETYAIVPDAYIYGRRQKKRTPSAAAKKNTAPRAPPEPYAAEAILTRRYPSQPRSPRRSRYRRRWSRSGP